MEVAFTAVAVTISALTFVVTMRSSRETATQRELQTLRDEVKVLRAEVLTLTRENERLRVLILQKADA